MCLQILYRKVDESLISFCRKDTKRNCGGTEPIKIGSDTCYHINRAKWPNQNNFFASFPTLTFRLDNNQNYTLTAAEYLFVKRNQPDKYCLGIYDNG